MKQLVHITHSQELKEINVACLLLPTLSLHLHHSEANLWDGAAHADTGSSLTLVSRIKKTPSQISAQANLI